MAVVPIQTFQTVLTFLAEMQHSFKQTTMAIGSSLIVSSCQKVCLGIWCFSNGTTLPQTVAWLMKAISTTTFLQALNQNYRSVFATPFLPMDVEFLNSFGIVLRSELLLIAQATLHLPLLLILVLLVVSVHPAQAQAHVVTATVEMASAQMESAALSMAGVVPLLHTAAAAAVVSVHPAQAQAHVVTATVEMASAQMESAALSLAGADPPPDTAVIECCVG